MTLSKASPNVRPSPGARASYHRRASKISARASDGRRRGGPRQARRSRRMSDQSIAESGSARCAAHLRSSSWRRASGSSSAWVRSPSLRLSQSAIARSARSRGESLSRSGRGLDAIGVIVSPTLARSNESDAGPAVSVQVVRVTGLSQPAVNASASAAAALIIYGAAGGCKPLLGARCVCPPLRPPLLDEFGICLGKHPALDVTQENVRGCSKGINGFNVDPVRKRLVVWRDLQSE